MVTSCIPKKVPTALSAPARYMLSPRFSGRATETRAWVTKLAPTPTKSSTVPAGALARSTLCSATY